MEDKELREREQFKAIITEYFGGEFDENYTVAEDTILDLMQKAHDMDKWVPVGEPPENRTWVLVYTKSNEVEEANYKHGIFYRDDTLSVIYNVTPRQPLPKGPKQKD